MAISPVVIKAIATAATDKRTWKAAAVLIASFISPIIVVVMMIGALTSSVETTNKNLLDYSFSGKPVPKSFVDEGSDAVKDMRDWLHNLDKSISKKEKYKECSLDENLVMAAFYCLNFASDLDKNFDYNQFCECFNGVEFEELETALQNVSEKFPQYQSTGNLAESIAIVYDYLNR